MHWFHLHISNNKKTLWYNILHHPVGFHRHISNDPQSQPNHVFKKKINVSAFVLRKKWLNVMLGLLENAYINTTTAIKIQKHDGIIIRITFSITKLLTDKRHPFKKKFFLFSLSISKNFKTFLFSWRSEPNFCRTIL